MAEHSQSASRQRTAVKLSGIWLLAASCVAPGTRSSEQHVVLESDGWEITGDLTIPSRTTSVPAVLLLHQAAGDRSAYRSLAERLAELGLASLRVDLRAHGESTNLGAFIPNGPEATAILEGSDRDIAVALRFLRSHAAIDATRIGVVGASYSGEAMVEAGRQAGFAKAYVALSPGSFSTESARSIDATGASWLFIRSRDEPVSWVRIAVDSVAEFSRVAEVWIVPGREHAVEILPVHPGLVDRVADWLASHLRESR